MIKKFFYTNDISYFLAFFNYYGIISRLRFARLNGYSLDNVNKLLNVASMHFYIISVNCNI